MLNIFKEEDNKKFKENKEKLRERSLKKFNNCEVQKIQSKIEIMDRFHFPFNKWKSLKFLSKSEFLLQFPSKNPNGRVYNKYWNSLNKIEKITLCPEYNSYDIKASIYQFLKETAIKYNLDYTYINYYIENKVKVRNIYGKKFLNSLPYLVEKKSTIYDESDFISFLILELKLVISKIKEKLFTGYENWERNKITDFIKLNNLTNFITNHDEILVYKTEINKVKYIPDIFSIQTISQRESIILKNRRNSYEMMKRETKKLEENERLIFLYSVRKRCKKQKMINKYNLKILSLKCSGDEDFLKRIGSLENM